MRIMGIVSGECCFAEDPFFVNRVSYTHGGFQRGSGRLRNGGQLRTWVSTSLTTIALFHNPLAEN
jgi:hypothetical protein